MKFGLIENYYSYTGTLQKRECIWYVVAYVIGREGLAEATHLYFSTSRMHKASDAL